jgi:hypothetical protein
MEQTTAEEALDRGGIRPLGQGASNTWHYLHDQVHTEVFSGGSAGPGKSFTGCLWEIHDSIKYPGTAGAIFRATHKDLEKSTQKTFFEVCDRLKLRVGTDYVFNGSKGTVFWNGGSTTQFDYLQYEPRDPNYSRLGGREYTRAFVDEADQVEERAVDVLTSRLRFRLTEFCHNCAAPQMASKSQAVDCDDYGNPNLWECYKCRAWTRGLLPKLLCTGNPGEYWTKYRWVFDKNGVPVELKEHQARVLMLLSDNPDKAHVASYRRQLEQAFKNEYDRQRLLHGNWLIQPRTGREFCHAFDTSKHVVRTPYDPNRPLHLSLDFNTAPYITGLLAQIWFEEPKKRWRCHFLQEICLEHPYSNTEALAKAVARELETGKYRGHDQGLFIYGDASGKNRSTQVTQGIRHNYDIVERVLRRFLHNHSDRVIRRNPAHTVARDWCNSIFAGSLPIWVTFDPDMTHTQNDMLNVKESADGGILKVMEKDRVTGVTFEKYGHCLQTHYYLTVGAFPEDFSTFVASLGS